jgi:hypothetical protein
MQIMKTKNMPLLIFSANPLEDSAKPQGVREPQVGNHRSRISWLVENSMADFRVDDNKHRNSATWRC